MIPMPSKNIYISKVIIKLKIISEKYYIMSLKNLAEPSFSTLI